MTFYRTAQDALENAVFATVETCVCCGEPASGPTVVYDMELPPTGKLHHFLMHRDCALTMAQRMICDAFPNRAR